MATYGSPIVSSPNMVPSTADVFNTSTAYAAGKVVWHDGRLYVFTVDHAAGAWTGSDAVAVKIGDELANLKSDLKLFDEYIPGTTQTISFDSSGNVSQIVHTDGSNNAVRTDAFTFGADTITEVRTLSTGESLTIATNTDTLVTVVTYSAA